MAFSRRGGFLVAWVAALALLTVTTPRAYAQRIADLPPANEPTAANKNAAAAPTLLLTASVASLDAVSALVKDIGPGAEVPFLSVDFIEQRMPFIGAGGLAHDRPLGVLFYVGKDLDLERSLTFVLPVNPGKAELKSFIDKGAQPVAGRTDVVSLEGVGFRRTKDQFVFGQITGAVAAVREDALTSTYAGGGSGLLARVDLDVAAVKKSLPDRYEAFFNEIDSGVDTKDPAGRAGAEFVTRIMREVTRLALSLSRTGNDGGARLAVRVEPFASPNDIAATPHFARPGFPEATTIVRADLAYPPAKALGRVTDTFKAVMEVDAQFAKLSPAQQDQVRTLASGFAALLLNGDAGSLGLESTNGQIVGHWVTRRPGAPIDLGRDMRALVQRATDLARSTNDAKPVMSYETYAAGQPAGTKVHRLVLLSGGQPELYLDAVARDATVFMSIAQTPDKFVERLLPLATAGDATTLLSGWADLGALTSGGLLPKARGKVDVKGQRVAWTAAPDAGALRIDIDLPKPLLQQLPKLVQQLQ